MVKWHIQYHAKIKAEIDGLPADMKAKLVRILYLFQEVGPLGMREPHVKSLGNKLMEIRLTGKTGISRVVYVVLTEKRVVLLHAFVKKTQKTPKSAIECAMKRMQEI